VNSTKGGKFMNPTDQARKVARKKELKRNKKLRQAVRAAAIKGKDPKMIISELENLDAVEYDPVNAPPYTEVMMKDRRRKLTESFVRVLTYYQREDSEKYLGMKETLARYESNRREKRRYYDAVKAAQRVTIDSIPLPTQLAPLPTAPLPPLSTLGGEKEPASAIPLPPTDNVKPCGVAKPARLVKGILKEQTVNAKSSKVKRPPPGPPPGPPPPLCDDGDKNDAKKRAIRAALQREKQLREAESLVENMSNGVSDRLRIISFNDDAVTPSGPAAPNSSTLPPPLPPPYLAAPPQLRPILNATSVPPTLRPPAPPLFPPGAPLRPSPGLPPGPPPGPPPAGLRPFARGVLVRQFGSVLDNAAPRPRLTMVDNSQKSALRLLPPLAPPSVLRSLTPNLLPLRPRTPAPNTPSIITSDPKLAPHLQLQQQQQLLSKNHAAAAATAVMSQSRDDGATIVATPVLRVQLHADVTRFTPTAVKVKRKASKEAGGKRKKEGKEDSSKTQAPPMAEEKDPMMKATIKESAYENFMKEIEELM